MRPSACWEPKRSHREQKLWTDHEIRTFSLAKEADLSSLQTFFAKMKQIIPLKIVF